jgi:hypothetical protein
LTDLLAHVRFELIEIERLIGMNGAYHGFNLGA